MRFKAPLIPHGYHTTQKTLKPRITKPEALQSILESESNSTLTSSSLLSQKATKNRIAGKEGNRKEENFYGYVEKCKKQDGI